MKYKVLMRNDIFVKLGDLSNGIRATDTPHLWSEDTVITDLMKGLEMVYSGPQLTAYRDNLSRCTLVDVELTII